MIKAILFDFDGVLTLDETGTQSICNYISKVTGIEKSIFEYEYRKYNKNLLIGKIRHEDIWQKICDSIGYHIDIDVLYDSFINTPINDGMLKLVNEVKKKDYKTGMVTDNKFDRIKSIVDYNNWSTLFDGVVVSAEVGSGKNQENIFNVIFQRLSIKPDECVFIDNNEENLVVPKKMGVNVIYFNQQKNDIAKLKDELAQVGVNV